MTPSARPAHGLGSWRVRRAYLFGTTAFCMGVVTFVLVNNMRGGVAEAAVVMAFGTIASSTGAYVFTASWEDVRINQAREYSGRGDHREIRRGRPVEAARVDDPDEEHG